MRIRIMKIGAALMLSIGINGLYAQDAIPATGGNATGSGGTVSFSVGQVFYISVTGTGGSVLHGVQQPFEISVVTELEEGKGISLLCSVYPNPATSYLIVHFEGGVKSQYTAYLFDMNGKLLTSQDIEDSETRIDVSKLAIATYFLKITQTKNSFAQTEIKSFKIIKN